MSSSDNTKAEVLDAFAQQSSRENSLPKKLLAIDGALGAITIALLGCGEERVRSGAGNDALERGLVLVDEILREANISPADLDAIAVGIGPGGFTGLRVCMSFAKALAFGLHKPLIGISSFEIIASMTTPQNEPNKSSATPQLVLISPRAGIVSVRLSREGLRLGAPEQSRTDGDAGFDDAAPLMERSGPISEVADFVCEQLGGRLVKGVAFPQEALASFAERGCIVQALPLFSIPPALALARLAIGQLDRFDAPSVHAIRANYGEAPAVSQPKSAVSSGVATSVTPARQLSQQSPKFSAEISTGGAS